MEEKSALIPSEDPVVEEQRLDPGDMYTTIFALEFYKYERRAQLFDHYVKGNNKLKDIILMYLTNKWIRYVAFFMIWASFFEQTEAWCKDDLKAGKFAPVIHCI